MKRKIIILAAVLILLAAGCGLTASGTSPKRAVEDMLGKYQALDKNVLDQLSNVINSESLTATQKTDYENVMRKQYQNLTYTIKDEVINGDKAVVTAEVEVYDFAKTNVETENYVTSHQSEFLGEDNAMSTVMYQDYKISRLKDTSERAKYTLDLSLTKVDKEWKLDDLTDTDRQKIHGLYSQ